jgi:hypothetical protein
MSRKRIGSSEMMRAKEGASFNRGGYEASSKMISGCSELKNFTGTLHEAPFL